MKEDINMSKIGNSQFKEVTHDYFNKTVQSFMDQGKYCIQKEYRELDDEARRERGRNNPYQDEYYVYSQRVYAYLTGKSKNSNILIKIKTRLDCQEDARVLGVDGGRCIIDLKNSLSKEDKEWIDQYKSDKEDKKKYPINPTAYMYVNQSKMFQRFENCVSYDRNSAYSWAMLQPMPYGDDLGCGDVEDGEIGFRYSDNGWVPGESLVFPGEGYADYRYKVKESPFRPYVEKWFERKKTAENKVERTIAKKHLNYLTGAIIHHNYVIHAAILEYSARYIKKFIDKYPDQVIYSNTDSIVCIGRNEELEQLVGDDIGQFKIDHQGDFTSVGFNYQWNCGKDNMEITYRGISKASFPKEFDILTDDLPCEFYTKYYIKEDGMIDEKEIPIADC